MFNRLALLLVICLIHPVNTLALSAKRQYRLTDIPEECLWSKMPRADGDGTTKIMTALIALEEGTKQ